MYQRPFWVCCYGIAPYFNMTTKRWTVHSGEPPMEGNRQAWTLMDIKTFKTAEEAFASKSYRRLYSPFSNPFVRVLLVPRTLRSIRLLTEFRLYPEENDMREFTFNTQRTITVQAETVEEACRLVEAELHDTETIISCDAEDEYEATVVAVVDQ